MTVSIVSVYYNRGSVVKESIQSLLDQTKKDIEIIVVDDGSTDDTVEQLSQFQDQRLTVISHENQGFTRSIRRGIEAASHDVIAIHGSGDYSYPERIEKQWNRMQETDAAIVGCIVENMHPKTKKTRVINRSLPEGHDRLEVFMKQNPFTHGEVMFKRSFYDKVGGYRPLFTFAQDIDLWLRMIEAGGTIARVDETLYRRYTLEDGVNESYPKRLKQMLYAELALQSIEEKRAGKEDPVNSFGQESLFLLKKNKRIANRIQSLAFKAYKQEDFDEFQFLLSISRQYKKTAKNSLWKVIGQVSRSPKMYKSFLNLMESAISLKKKIL